MDRTRGGAGFSAVALTPLNKNRDSRTPEENGDDRGECEVFPQGWIQVALGCVGIHGTHTLFDAPAFDCPVIVVSGTHTASSC